jgi:hypothetical protein
MKIFLKTFFVELKKQCLDVCGNNKLWLFEGGLTFIVILILLFYLMQGYFEMFRSFCSAVLRILK